MARQRNVRFFRIAGILLVFIAIIGGLKWWAGRTQRQPTAEKPAEKEEPPLRYFIVERPLSPGDVTSDVTVKKHEFKPSQNDFEAKRYDEYKQTHGSLLVEQDGDAYNQVVATEVASGEPLVKTSLLGPVDKVSIDEQVEDGKVAFVLTPWNNQEYPLVGAGFLKPNDQVDVIGVFNNQYAAILVKDVRVVAVGSDRGAGEPKPPPSEKDEKKKKEEGAPPPPPPPPKALTLALTQGESELLAAAVSACTKVDVVLHGMRPVLPGVLQAKDQTLVPGGHSVDEIAPTVLRDPETDAKLREAEIKRKNEAEDRKIQQAMQRMAMERQRMEFEQAKRAARRGPGGSIPPMPTLPRPVTTTPGPEVVSVMQGIRGDLQQVRQEVAQVRAQVADLQAAPRGTPPTPPPKRQVEMITGTTKQAVSY